MNEPAQPPTTTASAAELLKQRLQNYRQRIEAALQRCLDGPAPPPELAVLHEALQYAVLGGGKRMRPLLVYATGELFDAAPAQLDAPACALELIHCYSLVHDDLPAMDDDELRRGRPTCHRKFDEGTAILVGDALQALAFTVLCETPTDRTTTMLLDLGRACGPTGMVGGQHLDLAMMGRPGTPEMLRQIHRMKTGALIRAAIRMGAHVGRGSPAELHRLDAFADALGLAFQIHDDVLDVAGNTAVLGKPQGSDRERAKPTFPDVLGLEEARRTAEDYRNQARECLVPWGEPAALLRYLTDYAIQRDH